MVGGCPGNSVGIVPILQKKDNSITQAIKQLEEDIKTKKEYLEQIKNVFSSKRKKIRVLEVGADNGSFSKLITDTNSVHSISVVEPNQKMHKRPMRRYVRLLC